MRARWASSPMRRSCWTPSSASCCRRAILSLQQSGVAVCLDGPSPPQQHSSMRLLQDSWEAVQQWGPGATGAGDTAVVACLSFWDYSLVARAPGADAYKATGRCFSVAAGRISYTHAFKGACCGVPRGHACSRHTIRIHQVPACQQKALSLCRTRHQHRHGVLILAVRHIPAGQHAAAAQVCARPADSRAADAGPCHDRHARGRQHARARRPLQDP